jgi:hypothetical protein
MPTTAEIDRWRKTWLVAYIWWCGDEACDCYRPIVERLWPNEQSGFPWIRRERVWEGEFVTSPELGDMERLKKELDEAATRWGIRLRDHFGELEIEPAAPH